MAAMRKSGIEVQPVVIEGRAIAHTFWGKAWCGHLEKFSDFANRLPRGRTYVRNGSVCHLEIGKGTVKAHVQGSDLYTVTIGINPLPPKTWKQIKERCTGRISSILDLLAGKLSDGVMTVVTDRDNGLFPRPREIRMDCSCPDVARMCKHVAAVLYGVGSRLDDRPELLFLLRGVDHAELVAAHVEAAVETAVKGGSRRRIAENALSEVFGVEIETAGAVAAETAAAGKPSRKTGRPEGGRAGKREFPDMVTGKTVKALRKRLGMDRGEFARLLSVSRAAVSLWERSVGEIRLQGRSRDALRAAWSRLPTPSRRTRR